MRSGCLLMLLLAAAPADAAGPRSSAPPATVPPIATPAEELQVAALREMVRAVNAGEADKYARLYAENAVITLPGTGELKGRQAIEEHEVELLRQFPGARLGFYDVWQEGPLVVVHYAVNGRTPAGQPMG